MASLFIFDEAAVATEVAAGISCNPLCVAITNVLYMVVKGLLEFVEVDEAEFRSDDGVLTLAVIVVSGDNDVLGKV